jgi:hypothetical protein
LNAHAKLFIIIKALNEGWEPDWKNKNQYKYFPYFDMSSGTGLVYDGYDSWYSIACVGSRLCLDTSEKAIYAGNQFQDIYETAYIIK